MKVVSKDGVIKSNMKGGMTAGASGGLGRIEKSAAVGAAPKVGRKTK